MKRIVRDGTRSDDFLEQSNLPPRLFCFLNIAPPRIDPTTEFSGDPLDGDRPCVYIHNLDASCQSPTFSFYSLLFCSLKLSFSWALSLLAAFALPCPYD